MAFFVYILQSELDQSFYVGYTNDLVRRLSEHNAGLSGYTCKKIPWKLVYREQFESKSETRKREIFLKRQRNTAFYKKLIKAG
jgi:putative endonuclease